MKILYSFCLLVILSAFYLKPIYAQGKNDFSVNQFVTIVNPIRISVYSTDPKESLTTQYSQVNKRGLAATWLLTFDVFSDKETAEAAKQMDNSQELGIFLEVTPKYASESEVIYNKTDSWHRSNSVFLSGYTQQDRIKLIDNCDF